MDDKEFETEVRRIHEDHARVIALIAKLSPPTEEQRRAIQGIIDEMRHQIDESRRRKEDEQHQGCEWRQQRQENDLKYWRSLYENLVRSLAETEERKKR